MRRKVVAAIVLVCGLAALWLPAGAAGAVIAGEPVALHQSWMPILAGLTVAGAVAVFWSLRTLLRPN